MTSIILRRFFSSKPPTLCPFIKLHPVDTLPFRHFPTYSGDSNSIIKKLLWNNNPPNNVLIVKKPWNSNVFDATIKFIKFLNKNYPKINILVTPEVAEELNSINLSNENSFIIPIFTGSIIDIIPRTDLIVSLGGDGTILRGVSLFSNTSVPPVLSFSLGTLGFLLPFDFNNHIDAFNKLYNSNSYVLKRERIECHIVKSQSKSDILNKQREDLDNSYKNKNSINALEEIERLKRLSSVMDAPFDNLNLSTELETLKKLKIHAMNDIVLHRGSLPGLINLDVYINGNFLTRTTADGLIFATPTGSTAYSLSAGGSIVHPIVKCILLTPICPRSLSFRPLILPLNSHILIKVIGKENVKIDYSKSNAKLSIDGIPQLKMVPGDEIHIISESFSRLQKNSSIENNDSSKIGKSGVWCVVQSKGDWVNGINGMLGFNLGFKSSKSNNLL